MAVLLSVKGILSYRNPLNPPEGALSIGDNIVIDEPNVAEPRKGFKDWGTSLPLATDRVAQLLVYKDRNLRHFDSTLEYDSTGLGDFLPFTGTFSPLLSGLRIKGVEANSNFYFTDITGMKKISLSSSANYAANNITNAGGLKSLDFDVLPVNSGTGYLPAKYQVAYRTVWGTKDDNQNLILGAPSGRVLFTNSDPTNTVDVQLTIQVPADATNKHFIQVYRTASVDTTTFLAGITDGAGDEMQQVDEIPYDGVTNPLIMIDTTLDEFQQQGLYLYTNQISGEGIAQANDRPPIAQDVTLFRSSVFFANTKTSHKASLNLLATDGTDLDGYKFYMGYTGNVRTYTFEKYDSTTDPNPSLVDLTPITGGGTIGADTGGSPAQNIDTTARNLIRIINQDTPNPVTGQYLSTDYSLPGLMFFENDSLIDQKFYMGVDNIAISQFFNPELNVVTPATIQTSLQFSDNEVIPNRLYFSKFAKPEAVPAINYIDIGTRDKAIYRILALRDSLFALKEDGVFIITGVSAPDFSARLLDNSAPIIAPDTAAVLNNKIYCLSTQGVIEITETGIQVRSFNIENLVKSATKEGMDFKYKAFGVGYEDDRSYLLWLPTIKTDLVATQCFRYNTFTDSWTRWTIPATCGAINLFENKMYLGAGDRSNIYQERKSRTRFDYADRELQKLLLDANTLVGNEVCLSNLDEIANHDAFVQVQYITISFFNRMLKKLDMDQGLTDNDYFSTLNIVAGDYLQLKLIALDAKLAADATIGTYTPVSFPGDFAGQQTALNSIIAQLNSNATDTVYKNYRQSTSSVYFESTVTGVNVFTNKVTLAHQLPILYSTDYITIYKAIPTHIQWAPQHFGAADVVKQVHEGTLLMDHNNFYSAELGFSSDLNKDFSSISFFGRGTGEWGGEVWGNFIWGGEGNDAAFRTYIPKDKQRCRYLTIRFMHSDARNKFRVIGISLTPRAVSSRGYR